MFPALPKRARVTAALIALIALASVLAQWVWLQGAQGTDPWQTARDMSRFFTILTALLVVVTFGAAAIRWRRGIGAPWIAALTLSTVMVGAVYHVLLADLMSFTGLGWWADHGLHTVTPIAVALWWLAFAPKRPLVWADLPIFALWPAVYTAYALARGARDGIYPYPFMDLTDLSAAVVASNLGGLMILLLLGGVIFIAIGRYADR